MRRLAAKATTAINVNVAATTSNKIVKFIAVV
jgi:hypothetical protein